MKRSAAVDLVLLVVVFGLASCRSGPSADACENVASEDGCRACCREADASGAAWVDSECACLREP